jgi:hypothetical protein
VYIPLALSAANSDPTESLNGYSFMLARYPAFSQLLFVIDSSALGEDGVADCELNRAEL